MHRPPQRKSSRPNQGRFQKNSKGGKPGGPHASAGGHSGGKPGGKPGGRPGSHSAGKPGARPGRDSARQGGGHPGTPAARDDRRQHPDRQPQPYRSGSPIKPQRRHEAPEDEAALQVYQFEKPGIPLMQRIFADAGFPVTDDLALNRLWQFYLRLMARNNEINLTRIKKFADIVVRHYIDCGIVGKLTKLPSPLIDIGSGPGFPGVPLKVLFPETEIVLGEGRRVRVEFLHEVVSCLRIPGLSVYGHQIHESYTTPMRGIITRAVEVIPPTLLRVRGCLCRGGRAIFMKGPNCGSEIADAMRELKGSYKLVEDHKFTLPLIGHERRIAVFERLDGPRFEDMPVPAAEPVPAPRRPADSEHRDDQPTTLDHPTDA